MKSGQQDRPAQRRHRKPHHMASGTLIVHPFFAPLMGIWGALLGGLIVIVLPSAMVAALTKGTLIDTLGVPTQPVFAAIAALLVSVPLFALARSAGRRARRRADAPSVVQMAAREMRPIDPVRDLGSNSLDDPIKAMPFAPPARRDAGIGASKPQPKTVAEPEIEAETQPEPVSVFEPASVPRELDLAEFAVLPMRNAVWVQDAPEPELAPELEPEPQPEPTAEPASSAPIGELRAVASPPLPAVRVGTAALARLRAVPPSELSLAQMVERFAAALHEHRTAPAARALSATELAARDAALADALKALAALSGLGAGDQSSAAASDPLRAALAQSHMPHTAEPAEGRIAARGAA